ncbi:MAG: type II and III secretion system protein, partial [Gallionella sp.]
MRLRYLALLCAATTLVGCGTNPIEMSDKHMQRPADTVETKTDIPQPVMGGVVLPPPKPSTKVETYSVIVANVPAQEILFALARDAKINLDIHTGIRGSVTINAINQTLPQILTRIAKQVDMRYEMENGTLTVMPDSPYLHHYKINYVNMERDSESTMLNTTQVGPGDSNNSSKITITNSSKNHFWKTLIKNIEDILHETDKIFLTSPDELQKATETQPEVSDTSLFDRLSDSAADFVGQRNEKPIFTYREAASVIANPENGIITVRATEKQHGKIQEFIDQVMNSARRQVLIEATIVEVRLSDNYKQGIDWSALRLGNTGFEMSQGSLPSTLTPNVGTLVLDYANPTSKFGNISSSISLLETFGNVKVLSSPKLSVMNNQTAMLRVVDNLAYFSVEVTPGVAATATTGATSPTFT